MISVPYTPTEHVCAFVHGSGSVGENKGRPLHQPKDTPKLKIPHISGGAYYYKVVRCLVNSFLF